MISAGRPQAEHSEDTQLQITNAARARGGHAIATRLVGHEGPMKAGGHHGSA
jgi:hypothetical protein